MRSRLLNMTARQFSKRRSALMARSVTSSTGPVASTPRTLDKATNEWKDGDALFLRCSIWRQAAENVAESLHRGTRVIVSGRLRQRSYETREGEKRTVFELDVDEIGPSLKYATAKTTKTTRSGASGDGGGGGVGSAADPWATGPSSGGGQQTGASSDPWAAPAGGSDEPPF